MHDGALFDLTLSARVNDRSRDTPELRVLGVEDELAATASLALFEQFSATGRGSAKLYSDRERQYLGGGVTFDTSVGRYWALPDGWGIMTDDLFAGIYAHLALRVVLLVLPQ